LVRRKVALLLVEALDVEVEVQEEASGLVEVVHLEPQIVTCIAVSGMHPLRLYRHAREGRERRVYVVEEDVERAVHVRRARAWLGMAQERRGLALHLPEERGERLVFRDLDHVREDLDEDADGVL